MLQSVPSRGSANPRLLATFPCWTFIVVQVIGPNTLFLAETQQQLAAVSDAVGEIDALQIPAAAGIVGLWWKGDLYGAGSQAVGTVFKPYIGIPGVITSSGAVGAGVGAYGIGPSAPPANMAGGVV